MNAFIWYVPNKSYDTIRLNLYRLLKWKTSESLVSDLILEEKRIKKLSNLRLQMKDLINRKIKTKM